MHTLLAPKGFRGAEPSVRGRARHIEQACQAQRAVTSGAPPGRPPGPNPVMSIPPAQRRGGLPVPAAAHRVRGRPTVVRHPAHRVLHRQRLPAGTVGGLGARRPGRCPRRPGRRRRHRGAGTSPPADEVYGKRPTPSGKCVELPGKRLPRRRRWPACTGASSTRFAERRPAPATGSTSRSTSTARTVRREPDGLSAAAAGSPPAGGAPPEAALPLRVYGERPALVRRVTAEPLA
jgi:hypothetical protein